jgi:hypothetical protein
MIPFSARVAAWEMSIRTKRGREIVLNLFSFKLLWAGQVEPLVKLSKQALNASTSFEKCPGQEYATTS